MQDIPMDDESAQKYVELAKEYQNLRDRIYNLNVAIHKIKAPTFWWWWKKREIAPIECELFQLDQDIPKWYDAADSFYLNPPYDIKDFNTFHIHNALLRNINYISESMDKVRNNYNFVTSKTESKKNFFLAITAWLLTFLGLVISVISILGSIWNWW